jgi:hypothetical protein
VSASSAGIGGFWFFRSCPWWATAEAGFLQSSLNKVEACGYQSMQRCYCVFLSLPTDRGGEGRRRCARFSAAGK